MFIHIGAEQSFVEFALASLVMIGGGIAVIYFIGWGLNELCELRAMIRQIYKNTAKPKK